MKKLIATLDAVPELLPTVRDIEQLNSFISEREQFIHKQITDLENTVNDMRETIRSTIEEKLRTRGLVTEDFDPEKFALYYDVQLKIFIQEPLEDIRRKQNPFLNFFR